MNDTKKQQVPSNPKQLNENFDYSEASLTRKINNSDNTVSQRVPITPAPTKPPERTKNE